MVKSNNHRTDHGDNRECFVVNSDSATPTNAKMFEFLGVLLGYAFRSKSCLPYNIAPHVWKQINDQPLFEKDLKSFDTYAWQELQNIRKNLKEFTAEEFDAITDEQFVTKLTSGKIMDICPEGSTKKVDHTNVEEFISLVCTARFAEAKQQIKWM